MHWLLFIHKILIFSTCFEPQVLIFRRIRLYTCSIWYCHSLWEFLVACRYTAWVRTDCRGKVVGGCLKTMSGFTGVCPLLLGYRPAVFSRHLRFTALSFQHGKTRCVSKMLLHFFFYFYFLPHRVSLKLCESRSGSARPCTESVLCSANRMKLFWASSMQFTPAGTILKQFLTIHTPLHPFLNQFYTVHTAALHLALARSAPPPRWTSTRSSSMQFTTAGTILNPFLKHTAAPFPEPILYSAHRSTAFGAC